VNLVGEKYKKLNKKDSMLIFDKQQQHGDILLQFCKPSHMPNDDFIY